jgi:hypothetical protein
MLGRGVSQAQLSAWTPCRQANVDFGLPLVASSERRQSRPVLDAAEVWLRDKHWADHRA